jgi:hypothetical protein
MSDFVFDKGQGHTTIDLNGGTGVVQIGADIAASDVLLQADNLGDLTIALRSDPADSITFGGALSANVYHVSYSAIQQVDFADGSVLQLTVDQYGRAPDLAFTWVGSATNTTLVGSYFGANTFDLGPGSDTITAGNGSFGDSNLNTFVFDVGDGHATVAMNGGVGIVQLGADISAADVLLQADNSGDLTIALRNDPADSIIFTGALSSNVYHNSYSLIQQIDFGDGSTLALTTNAYNQAPALVFTWVGTSTDTVLVGSDFGSNTFDLGPGGDTITAGNGSIAGSNLNTFLFDAGDGHATVNMRGGIGIVQLGTDIAASDVLLQADSSGDLTIALRNDPNDSITFIGALSTSIYNNTYSLINEIEFGDGSVLQLTTDQYNRAPNLAFTWVGTPTDTVLVGSDFGSNTFDLGPGGDTVTAGNGSDGGSGQNAVQFDKGDGNATVNMNGGQATLQLGADIAVSDLLLQGDSSGDLTVALRDDPADSIIFVGALGRYGNGQGYSQVTALQFGTGASAITASLAEVAQAYETVVPNLAGVAAFAGYLPQVAASASYTAFLSALEAAVGGPVAAVTAFAANHQPGDLWFTQSGNDLVVTVLGTTNQATISNWFVDTNASSAPVVIAGSIFSIPAIDNIAQVMTAYQSQTGFDPTLPSSKTANTGITVQTAQVLDLGLQTIVGTAGDDTIALKGGATVSGGGGFDTYDVDYGAGACVIAPPPSSVFQAWAVSADDSDGPPWNGELVFRADISAGNVTFSRVTGTNLGSDLVISLNGTSDKVTLRDWFDATGLETVTDFVFADGSSVSANAIWAATRAITGVLPVAVDVASSQTVYVGSGQTYGFGDGAINVAFVAQNNVISTGRGNGTISLNSGLHGTSFQGDSSPPSNLLVLGSGIDTVSINEDYDLLTQHGGGILLTIAGNNNMLIKEDAKPDAATSIDPAEVTVNGNTNSLRFLNGEGQTMSDTSSSVGNTFLLNNATNAVINVYGTHDVVFLNGGTGEHLNNYGAGMTVYLGPGAFNGTNGPNVTLANVAADHGITIAIAGGVGAYTSVSSFLGAAVSDGAGGSVLALGTGSLHILGLAPSSLTPAEFAISPGSFDGIGY